MNQQSIVRLGDNNSLYRDMSISDLYATTRGSPFGIEEYSTTRQYQDPRKLIQDRRAPRRRSLDELKKIKRPSFMDEQIKQFVSRPAPGAYNLEQSILKVIKNKINPLINKKATKNTYIDTIIKSELKKPTPGIGKYNLSIPIVTEDRFKKKGSTSERWTKFDEQMVIGQETPGVGKYEIKTQWIKGKPETKLQKHYMDKRSQSEKLVRSRSSKLGPSTYTPIPGNYNTFEQMARSNSQRRSSLWVHGRIDKRNSQYISLKPSPADYNVSQKWGQVKDKILQKKLSDKVSRGPSKLIYN